MATAFAKAYRVQTGDSLWRIAERELGSGCEWPRIFAFNNLPAVIAQGAKRIANPDLIYPNDLLYIPVLANVRTGGSASTSSSSGVSLAKSGSLVSQLPSLQLPHLNMFSLPKTPFVLTTPTATIRLYWSGSMVLAGGAGLQLSSVADGTAQLAVTTPERKALIQLLSEGSISVDPKTKEVKVGITLVTKSNSPYSATSAVGIETSNTTGMPVIKAEFRFPELRGFHNGFSYTAINVALVVEIEPRAPLGQPKFQPIPIYAPVLQPAFRPAIDWQRVASDLKSVGQVVLIAVGVIVLAVVVGLAVYFTAAAILPYLTAGSLQAASVLLTTGLALRMN